MTASNNTSDSNKRQRTKTVGNVQSVYAIVPVVSIHTQMDRITNEGDVTMIINNNDESDVTMTINKNDESDDYENSSLSSTGSRAFRQVATGAGVLQNPIVQDDRCYEEHTRPYKRHKKNNNIHNDGISSYINDDSNGNRIMIQPPKIRRYTKNDAVFEPTNHFRSSSLLSIAHTSVVSDKSSLMAAIAVSQPSPTNLRSVPSQVSFSVSQVPNDSALNNVDSTTFTLNKVKKEQQPTNNNDGIQKQQKIDTPTIATTSSSSSAHQIVLALLIIFVFISTTTMFGYGIDMQQTLSSRSVPVVIDRTAVSPTPTVCVSGGGFSGFWFTLGRLQHGVVNVSSPLNNTNDNKYRNVSTNTTINSKRKHFYCYSSGCLGVVAALSRYTMEEMYTIAYNIQLQWKNGTISRYDVVTAFVDELLSSYSQRLNADDLSSLHIITSKKDKWFGIKTNIRTPQSIDELRIMLIQTTWIPFAIGNDLFYQNHMDGAFTTYSHPKCDYSVGLSNDFALYMNVINVNLGRDKVETFWNKGLEYGL